MRADALVAMAEAAQASGLACRNAADRQQVIVHVDAGTLAGIPGGDGVRRALRDRGRPRHRPRDRPRHRLRRPPVNVEKASPGCAHSVVSADLLEDWPAKLTGAGFRLATPTAWLAEALLVYLDAGEAGRLLEKVTQLSEAGSRLASEHGDPANNALLTQARAMPTMDQFTSLRKGGLGENDSAWLCAHGWRAVQTHDLPTTATAYGQVAPADSAGGFITALRE